MIHNHEVPSSILGPATWKSSTYESFVSAFLFPVNTAWTPNLFISFNFHYFHRGAGGRSGTVFHLAESILQLYNNLRVPGSLQVPDCISCLDSLRSAFPNFELFWGPWTRAWTPNTKNHPSLYIIQLGCAIYNCDKTSEWLPYWQT